jgi:hypothetical protein
MCALIKMGGGFHAPAEKHKADTGHTRLVEEMPRAFSPLAIESIKALA